MPSHARKDIVQDGEIAVYHTWSRCVQRAWLCGRDPFTGRDYSHRREWNEALLEYQSGVFAVDVGGYQILGNHQHALCRTRPDIAALWSDEELAWRWKSAWPSWRDGQWTAEPTDEEIAELIADPLRIEQIRKNLSSLSWFMARWKEPFARMCNQEMQRRGHFFEQRFGSRLLKNDADVLCCSLYVDVNQVRAGAADSLEHSNYSSIQRRILAWREREVQASLEAFQRRPGDGEYPMELEDMERLFRDCWLSPITPHAPLTTSCGEQVASIGPRQPAAEAAEAEAADGGGEAPPATAKLDQQLAPAPSPRSGQAPAGNPAAPDVATSPRPVAEAGVSQAGQRASRRRQRRPVSRTIHERLRRRRRRRASDQCFLPLPWVEYHRLVEWAAARAAATQHEAAAAASLDSDSTDAETTDGVPTRRDRPHDLMDAPPTETASTWTRAVHAFRAWLSDATCEAGGAIAELAASVGLAPLPRGDPGG